MAEVLLGGRPFDETVSFFVDELGFRLQFLTPADDPALCVLDRPGLTLRIDRNRNPEPVTLLVEGNGPSVTAPNGTVVEFTAPRTLDLPALAPELVVAHESSAGAWVSGRAGMRYRDLIPSRLGGRYIASHIEVCDGGPVADIVHHHQVRFQMIFCHKGWVDVVYQDQGPPFRMEAGDAVLQPPGIRHKVLASSAGARVVEIGCPAQHDTLFDHDLLLPTAEVKPDRRFGDQRFVRHVAADAPWEPSPLAGFEQQHTGIAAATDGLGGARVHRLAVDSGAHQPEMVTNEVGEHVEFQFFFVLEGQVELTIDSSETLSLGSAVTVPSGTAYTFHNPSSDLQLLDVSLPA